MLYHILLRFAEEFSILNVARYISFRVIISMLSALLISFMLSPWFIRKLKKGQIGQIVRDDGPSSHFSKQGTPTMGGGLILGAVLIPVLMWMDYTNSLMWFCVIIFTSYGILGFMDDYAKVSKKNSKGVPGRVKLIWQTLIAVLVCATHVYLNKNATILNMPFFKGLAFDLGWFYVLFAAFIIVGTSNAVNLTDGLDGLAIGPVMTSAASYAILAYISGNHLISHYLHFPYVAGAGELAIFAASIIGAGMGFLWYNTYPAQVFMGDIGSLPLGGALGALAVFSKHEVLLVLVGGIFVLEACSVIAQVSSFKLTGKRVLKMAPIHHHFELKGWPEPKVIVRFWIISAVLALLSLLSLKIR